MKLKLVILLAFATNSAFAQLFESQWTNLNPSYTAMQDDRFADLSFTTIPMSRYFNITNFSGSYQHNLDKINSGLGLTIGHTRFNVDDFKLKSFNTALSYRYAHRFENGLRLAGGARFGFNHSRFSDSDEATTLYGFIFSAGAMASYKNFNFGFALPIEGDGFLNIALNGSYRMSMSERVELTAFSGTFFGGTRFRQSFTIKSEFKQKFWLAARFIVVNNNDFYNNLFSSGLYFGHRIKQSFHVYGGTDFGFSSNSFSLYDPRVGLVYQFNAIR